MRILPKLILVIPVALALSGCVSNPNQIGFGLAGGALGGGLGSMVGHGKGKTIATAAGALLGALGGGAFGGQLDQIHRNEAGIIRNHHSINQANKRRTAPLAVPVPMTYPGGGYGASQGGYNGNNMRLNCSVRNNYVVCNGQ